MNATGHTSAKILKPGKTTAFFICVLVAAFLWFIRSLNATYTRTVKIPVEFRNIPQHKKPITSLPDFVTMDIKASGLKLFFILFNQPFKKLEIDFNSLKTVGRNYVLSAGGMNVERTFKFEPEVKHISPDTLYFIENSGYQKNVPVKLVYDLKCAPGYGYKYPVINPSFVSVTGDSAAVQRIDTVYSQSFTLNELSEPIEKEVALLKPSASVYLGAAKVKASFKVERLMEQSLVLPVSILNAPEGVKSVNVFPSRVRIKFTSLQNDFNMEDTLHFKAAVNIHNSRNGKAPVFLSTQPGNINVLSIEPREAEIIILKK